MRHIANPQDLHSRGASLGSSESNDPNKTIYPEEFAEIVQRVFVESVRPALRKCNFHYGCDMQCEAYYDHYDLRLMATAEDEGMVARGL